MQSKTRILPLHFFINAIRAKEHEMNAHRKGLKAYQEMLAPAFKVNDLLSFQALNIHLAVAIHGNDLLPFELCHSFFQYYYRGAFRHSLFALRIITFLAFQLIFPGVIRAFIGRRVLLPAAARCFFIIASLVY